MATTWNNLFYMSLLDGEVETAYVVGSKIILTLMAAYRRSFSRICDQKVIAWNCKNDRTKSND